MRLFLDDTPIYLTLENKNDSGILQRDLDRLQAWESKWDMEFNPSKCQVISVTTARTPLDTQYIWHGQVLEVVSSARYLGWISLVTLDLLLFCYERDFMMSLSVDEQADVIDAFNTTSRYLDDILHVNYVYFDNMVSQIYPSELQLNKANTSDTEAAF